MRGAGRSSVLIARVLIPWLAAVAPSHSEPATDPTPCAVTFQPAGERGIAWRANATLTCDARSHDLPVGEKLLIGLTLAPSRQPGDYEENWERYEIDLPAQVFVLDPSAPQASLTFQTPARFAPEEMEARIAVWRLAAIRPCDGGRDGCRKFGFALGTPNCGDSELGPEASETWCTALRSWEFEASSGKPVAGAE